MSLFNRLYVWSQNQPRTRFNWSFWLRLMAMAWVWQLLYDMFLSEDVVRSLFEMSWQDHKQVMKFAFSFGVFQTLLFWKELNVPITDWLEEANKKMESRMQ